MKLLKRSMFLTVALALALSGLSIGLASAADDQPEAGVTLQEDGGAWLGVSIADTEDGVSVVEVVSDSPADEAGIRAGDIIAAVDDVEIDSAEALVELIATYAPGDEITVTKITVTTERSGTVSEHTVTLGERPADLEMEPPFAGTMPRFGIGGTFDVLGMRAELTDEGLEIVSLEDDSPFAEAGLQEGDVITQINGVDVSTDMGPGLMRAFDFDEPLSLTVLRDGEEIEVEVDLGEVLGDMMPDIDLPDISLPDADDLRGRGFGFGSMVARILGLDAEMTDEGLLINEITEDSPLADTDLQAGDVVTAVNDLSLTDFEPGAIADLLGDLMPGGTLTLDVLRAGENVTVEIELPESFDFQFSPGEPGFGFRRGDGPQFRGAVPGMMMGAAQPTQLGVQFAIITPELAAERGLDVEQGALIEQVYDDTPAADAGLQVGDVITAVDGDAVDQRRTLRERLLAYDEGEVVTLTVLRDGEELSIDVTLGPNSGMFGYFRGGPGDGGMYFFGPGMMDEEFFRNHPFMGPGGRFDFRFGPFDDDEPEIPNQEDEATLDGASA